MQEVILSWNGYQWLVRTNIIMNSSGKSLNTSEQLILEKLPWELRQLLERFEIGAMDDAVGDDTDRIRKEVVDDYFRRIHSA